MNAISVFSHLTASFARALEERVEPQSMGMAPASKLAVILHRMWTDATEFGFGTEPAALQCSSRL